VTTANTGNTEAIKTTNKNKLEVLGYEFPQLETNKRLRPRKHKITQVYRMKEAHKVNLL
jgi:hypothetical protein